MGAKFGNPSGWNSETADPKARPFRLAGIIGPKKSETRVSKVTYRIWFERDGQADPGERLVDDPREAGEIAVEMANRPDASGGTVNITLWGLAPEGRLYSVPVKPGQSIEWVKQQLQEKSARLPIVT